MSNEEHKAAKLKLKNDCTIYEVTQLHHKLLAMLQESNDVVLDISDVKNIDVSFIQLLISVQIEVKNGKAKFKIIGDSELVNELLNNIYCQTEIDIEAA